MSTESKDYTRISRAIAYIRQHHTAQPDLVEVAGHVGLSEFHFQKMFTRWAGVSPKRFLQHLTIERAKALINKTGSILELTYDVGLSGPGRLHDLFINLEAVSPGEYKKGGAGITVRYGIHDTRFGRVLIATTERGICNLQFLEATTRDEAVEIVKSFLPNAKVVFDNSGTEELCRTVFREDLSKEGKQLTLLVKGTNFQIQVWRALLRIPHGSLTTYQTIASMIDRPGAARAVGNAIGKNPIAFLIPCHRVIRGSGQIGGYRWGSDRKCLLIGWEGRANTLEPVK